VGRKTIFLLASPEKHTREIWAVSLRDCDLDYHPKIHAVPLACPGVDHIRLWPLPVE